jgi:hypothetical protein
VGNAHGLREFGDLRRGATPEFLGAPAEVALPTGNFGCNADNKKPPR